MNVRIGNRRAHRSAVRLLVAVAVTLGVAAAGLGTAGPDRRAEAATAWITLRFFDRTGDELSAAQARSVIECRNPRCTPGGRPGWANDALVDPDDLIVVKAKPLRERDGRLAFRVPSRPLAFVINWPTEPSGSSMLLVDNLGAGFGSPGTVNVTYRAALDARARLATMLAARPGYVPSAGFTAALAAADTHLAVAAGTSDESVRGARGQLALDQLAVAAERLLAEYGISYARSVRTTRPPWLGVTLDTIDGTPGTLTQARAITEPWGWVRLVFDRGVPPAAYAPAVTAAKARGLRILGQPIDSSAAKRYTPAGYLARIQEYVTAFPEIDAWEVGNEVNGRWTGRDIAAKVAEAAAWVQAHSSALVVCTLYWQLGTDLPRAATFNWLRDNLPPPVRADLDVVLLSTWVEDAPLGPLGFDPVMRALADELPGLRIGLGELGYWNDDTSRVWWAFDRTDPYGTARRAVSSWYLAASLGYPSSVGGGFWWYFVQEMQPPAGEPLARTVADIRDALAL